MGTFPYETLWKEENKMLFGCREVVCTPMDESTSQGVQIISICVVKDNGREFRMIVK